MTSTLAHAIDLLRAERADDAERVLADLARDDQAEPDALPFLGIVRHTQGCADAARLLATLGGPPTEVVR